MNTSHDDEAEEAHMREIFASMDTDGSGSIDQHEVAMLAEQLGEFIDQLFCKC